MKKTISIQCSSLRIFSRRMIFLFVILSFVSQSFLHAEIQNGSFEFDGRLRNYMVYLPTNYTGTINFPLVICLHPYGWGAERMMNYTNMNQVADASDFIVVYPSAIPDWNSGIADNPNYPTPNVDDVGFINALIDIMSNSYSIDPERIYACGFSNGGLMSYKLACQLSNRIVAIACVGGLISTSTAESCCPLRTMPVLHIHGTADPYGPINGGTGWYSVDQTLSYWTNFNDCVQADTIILPDLDPTDGCTVEKTTYTNCSDNSDVVYYKVINGGHTWPGAGSLGSAFGNTNQDIDASVEIWNFFKNYKLVTRPVVDFNGDGSVDIKDLLRIIESWGRDDPMADIAPTFGDGIVDALDLELLMSYWGQSIDDPTLIAHWALDETDGEVAYNSTRVNHAFVVGEVVWLPNEGQVDGAIQLDGIDDCVVTGPALNPKDGPFSVLTWIKGGATGQVIVAQKDSANWLITDSSTGNLMTELKGPGRGGKPLQSQTNITDGDWHRIGFVWDGSNRTLYVDGLAVAEDTQDSLQGSDKGLYIGCGKAMEAGTFFSGLIDDVRIYNRAATP
jgi:polyhydroxybutyrate depolymerase